MGRNVIDLAMTALHRITRLESDEAKALAIGALGNALTGCDNEPERVGKLYQTMLETSLTLAAADHRLRAFSDVCAAIAVARVPRTSRGDLLDLAVTLAGGSGEPAERIERAQGVLEAMIDLHWGEAVGQELAKLVDAAQASADSPRRARTLALLALSMAKASDCDGAIAVLDRLPLSGLRARGLALVAMKAFDEERVDEAARLIERALAESRALPDSVERAMATLAVLTALLDTGMETSNGDALGGALDGIDEMNGIPRRDALLGALEAIPTSALDPARLDLFTTRLEASIDEVSEPHIRGELLGKLAMTYAAIGDVDACERVLKKVVSLARQSVDIDLVDASGKLPGALPFPAIVSAFAEAEVPAVRVVQFALDALDLVRAIGDSTSVGVLLRQFARLFASPALEYEHRVRILDKALAIARTIEATDERVQVATAIANGFSLAGAVERGEVFFAGLVTGADPAIARRAHQERAVALVRMNCTADALAELGAAARTPGADEWHAIQELGRTAVRCGFIADALQQLERVEVERQSEARAQLADTVVESTWLDPHLRVIALESLASGAGEAVAETIACLLAQLRLHEGIGDPAEVVARAFERTTALADRRSAAIFEQQLVNALIACVQRSAA